MVVLGHGALTFEHLDHDSRLVVLVRGEGLGLLGWDNTVTGDQLGHDSTNGFNTKGQWGNVEKQYVLGVFATFTGQDSSLDGGTECNGLVWVDAPVWFFAVEKVFQQVLDFWDTGGATNKHKLVDFVFFHTCVRHNFASWS